MIAPDFAKVASDTWPLTIGALIGSAVGHFLFRSRPDLERVRKQLGRALDRFADVPTTRLEPAMLAATTSVQCGWGSIRAILVTAFWFVVAMVAAELYRTFFPEFPRWHSFIICGLVAASLGWVAQSMERRLILQRLERLTR